MHLIRKAFDKGFRDFQQGNFYDSPYETGTWHDKEWKRGQDQAFFMYQRRAETRELYRKNLNDT